MALQQLWHEPETWPAQCPEANAEATKVFQLLWTRRAFGKSLISAPILYSALGLPQLPKAPSQIAVDRSSTLDIYNSPIGVKLLSWSAYNTA